MEQIQQKALGQDSPRSKEINKTMNTYTILWVSIITLLVLYALLISFNYFQIINLSSLSPFFSTLPVKNSTPSSAPIDSKTFLQKSISQLLLFYYLPPKNVQTVTAKRQISLAWNLQGINFSASVLTKSDNIQNQVLLTIQLPNKNNVSLNPASAASLAQQYVQKQSSTPYVCDNTGDRIFCQQITKTANEKISIGVRQNLASSAKVKLVIIACAVPPTNILFRENGSCF